MDVEQSLIKQEGRGNLPAYFSNVAGQLSHSSVRIYQHDALAFVQWLNDQGYDLTRENVIQYRAYLGEHYAPTTAQRMWSVVTRILKEQVISGHLAKNPAEGVHGFKAGGNASKHIALTEKEAGHLLSVIDTGTKMGLRDFAIVLTLLKTGLRRFECAALNLGDIQMVHGHYTLFLRETKGSKLDRVKLAVDAWRAICNYLDVTQRRDAGSDAPIFVSFKRGNHPTTNRILPDAIYDLVLKYAAMAGIERLSPHGLRASFITIALENKVPLHKVQYAARHSDSRTTEHYDKRRLDLDDNPTDYIHIPLPAPDQVK